jgi:uncharacterized protein YciU (UPF0263 family)
MKQNRLGLATAVLVVLVGLTAWQLSTRRSEDSPQATAEVTLPKLKRADIDELELTAPERGTVRLVKQGETWRVAAPVDAEADQDAVSTALAKLEELEATGIAATKAQNHARLEVDAEKGTRVIAKGQGKVLLDGYVGIFQASNSMFRLEGQDAVATVKGSIRYAFNKQLREWRDRTVTKVETTSVKAIRFENKNGTFEFARDGEDWQQVVAKGQKPIAPLDVSKVKGLVGTAASLNAVDFAAAEVTEEQAGLGDGAAQVTVQVDDEGGAQQIVYRVGAQEDQNFYLRREGDPAIYLVSSWIGGRLTPETSTFVKEPEPQGSRPESGAPVGSAQNPIKVEPLRHETVSKAQAEALEKAAKKKP